MTEHDYLEIPTWPIFNNLNRVYLGKGICPTLTTQLSPSKPPLVLVRRDDRGSS